MNVHATTAAAAAAEWGSRAQEVLFMDIVFVAATLGFFGLCLACEAFFRSM